MTVKTFISRPLLSIVISVFIVLLGVISLLSLPVERYPDIAPPAIYVWASYPGASAETVQKSVVMPLEEAINGVEGMTYMTSSASNGSASITIYFEQGANADMAAVNVQNRVIQAQAQLPAEVLQTGVATEKRQPGQLRIIALESPNGTYDENFLSNYFYNNLRPALLRIKGVGKVEVWGAQYALRIWLKPDVMARHKLMPSDISAVLAEQNIEASVGSLGSNSDNVFQYMLRYTGRKTEVSGFENLVIASLPTGEELLLKDVADVELGQSDYDYINSINGHPGVMGSVSQMAGSNATKINLEIDKLLAETEKSLPKDVKIVTFDNTNDFLFASIREVILTLVIAIVLVLVVVLFFLQDFRATLIPAVGIIVSLVGTFAFMKVAGFSVNLLTLFALVLVIGTVVDDSIVVVEAVKAKLDEDFTTTRKASEDAMNGLSVTLFTTTLVFMVIFIPVAFVGGITREESRTSGRVIFIFLICIVIAYLVMVALYESLYIPLAVMLSVPFGLAGSLLFAKLFGVENNIYMQIGMVMLVGLLSKTAILLTEYASQARREGMSLAEAALSSAKVRLRPILMTSLTMIIGMLPLMFASGVGANGSRTIGVCVVGGMLFGTLGLLLTVPVLFVVFQKIQERIGKNRSHQ